MRIRPPFHHTILSEEHRFQMIAVTSQYHPVRSMLSPFVVDEHNICERIIASHLNELHRHAAHTVFGV